MEVFEFVESLNIGKIIANDRLAIAPSELDIYIPEQNLAIEYNGLYWHSEAYREKRYHKQKSIDCEKVNIRLIHIWDDEWRDKRGVVESMIKHALSITEKTVFARKCKIERFDKNLYFKEFFDSNHISGHTKASKAFALMHDGEIVDAR